MTLAIEDLRQLAKPLPLFKPGMRDSIRRCVKTQTRRVANGNPKYKPGDIVYLREPLVKMGGVAVYKDSPGMVPGLNWRWKRDSLTQMSMPKEAARCFYRITDVRKERLQEIDNNDALAEGTPDIRNLENGYDMRDCFAVLWDHINAERGYSWGSNPWVFVYEWQPIAAGGGA